MPMTLTKTFLAALAGAALLAGCGRDDAATTGTTNLPPPAAQSEAPMTRTPAADASRSAGQTVEDAALTAKVKSALLAADDVKGTDVNVDTLNGAVTLKGEVETQAQADRAVAIARGTEGVTRVDSQLMVKARS